MPCLKLILRHPSYAAIRNPIHKLFSHQRQHQHQQAASQLPTSQPGHPSEAVKAKQLPRPLSCNLRRNKSRTKRAKGNPGLARSGRGKPCTHQSHSLLAIVRMTTAWLTCTQGRHPPTPTVPFPSAAIRTITSRQPALPCSGPAANAALNPILSLCPWPADLVCCVSFFPSAIAVRLSACLCSSLSQTSLFACREIKSSAQQ